MATSSVRIRLQFVSIIGILWLFVALSASSQENRDLTSNPVRKVENTDNKLTIKVNVEEIRLDAVVEDWRGRLITDLTADDFEICQDDRKQNITSCQYISLQSLFIPIMRILSSGTATSVHDVQASGSISIADR